MPRNQREVVVLDYTEQCDFMNRKGFHKTGMTLAAATLVAFSTPNIFAQDTNAFGQYEMPTGTPANSQPLPPETQAPPPETPITSMPSSTTPLSGAQVQILQLSQAKISDSTIITYIQNSSTIYGLNASQIVYLKQNGVSEPVINAMLNQSTAMAQQQQQQQAQMPPPGSDQSAAAYQGAVAQPSSPAPSTTYVPDSQTADYNSWASPYYYYPYYGYNYPYYGYGGYWPYWGWGWGGYRGYGYRGYYGGYHGYYGGGFHGSFGGGGFHGGGGGGGGFHGGGGGGGHR
jgi:hypothetical protein